jgi:hypothetical protein
MGYKNSQSGYQAQQVETVVPITQSHRFFDRSLQQIASAEGAPPKRSGADMRRLSSRHAQRASWQQPTGFTDRILIAPFHPISLMAIQSASPCHPTWQVVQCSALRSKLIKR